MLARLAHEVSHSWFGLVIGAKDWTEEWLSEVSIFHFMLSLKNSLAVNLKNIFIAFTEDNFACFSIFTLIFLLGFH